MSAIVYLMFFCAFVVVLGIVGPLFVDAYSDWRFEKQWERRRAEIRRKQVESIDRILAVIREMR